MRSGRSQQQLVADGGQDSVAHRLVLCFGEETAKDQIAACVEKFVDGLNEDLKAFVLC